MNLVRPVFPSIACLLWLLSCQPSPAEVPPAPLADRPERESPQAATEPPTAASGMAVAIVHRDSEARDGCPLDRAVAALGNGCERVAAHQMPGPWSPAATEA